MTEQEFETAAAPVIRHGLTLAAGALAAHGMAVPADLVSSIMAAAVITIPTLLWSLAAKSRIAASVLSNTQPSDIETLANAVQGLVSQKASPLVVAHFASALAMVASHELAQQQVGAQDAPGALTAPVAAPAPPATETPETLAPVVAAGDGQQAVSMAQPAAPSPFQQGV